MNLKSNDFFDGCRLHIRKDAFFFKKIIEAAADIFMFHGGIHPFLNADFLFFAKSRCLLGIFCVFLIKPCNITT